MMARLLTLSLLLITSLSAQARFLTEDAWEGDPQTPPSLHKYLYAYQNPTVYVDPDGNAPVLMESADALSQWADDTRKTASNLENNGINVFPAAAMGLGAGTLDILSGGVQIINQGVNLGVDALASPNSNSLFVHESRADLQETRGEVTNAIESTVNVAKITFEDPSAAGAKLKDITKAGVQSFAQGDTGAVGNTFSALAVAPSGIAAVNATAQGIRVTGQGIRSATNKFIPNNRINMRSPDDLMGVEPASPELLSAVSKKRDVVVAQPGSEELRMLDYFGAEASVGAANNTHILLRQNPSKAALLEEFLHGTQSKLGITDRLGTSGMGSAETHVKDFMIRHQKMLELSDEDVQILQVLKDKGL